MNIVKQCRMNCSPHPTFEEQQLCDDCEDHDTDLVYARFDKTTHCIILIDEKNRLECRIASLENKSKGGGPDWGATQKENAQYGALTFRIASVQG